MKAIKLALFVTIMPVVAFAQLRGTVYDSGNELPLEGVVVMYQQELLGTSAHDGSFSVNASFLGDTLLLKHIGYQSRYVSITDSAFSVSLEPKSNLLNNVVVQAYTGRERAFKVPASLNVLVRPELGSIAQNQPAAVFNSFPGVFMHSGARNTSRITIRGVGSRSMYTTTKIKAYLNQIPLTSGTGETSLEDLDLALTDRITLLKGPASSIYGAALGGTVLYRMGGSADKSGFVQDFRAGSFGTLQNQTKAYWGNKSFYGTLSYTKLKSNGFRANDTYNRDAITFYAGSQLSDNLHLSYLGRWHTLKAHIPSSLNKNDYENNPEVAADSWSAVSGHEAYQKWLNGLTLRAAYNPDFTHTTSLYFKHYKGEEIRPFNVLDDQSNTTGLRTLINWKSPLSIAQMKVQAGYEIFRESYDWQIFETLTGGAAGEKLNTNSQLRLKQDLFASLKWSWNTLSLNAGINGNKTGYRYEDLTTDSLDMSDQKYYEWIVSPRFSLSWQPFENLLFYGSISHGFSTPAYEETLNASGFVEGSIKPETGWNREFGIRARFWEKRILAKAVAYSVNVNDLLVTKRIAEDEFFKLNAGNTVHNGLEFLGKAKFLDIAALQGNAMVSYMLTDYRFRDFEDEGNDYSNNRLPGIPNQKLNVVLRLQFAKNLFVHTNWLTTGKMPMNDANTKYYNGYNRLNVKAGMGKTIGEHWHFRVYAGVRNLTNTHYASMILINAPSYGGSMPRYYYPAAPRHYFAGIALHFDHAR